MQPTNTNRFWGAIIAIVAVAVIAAVVLLVLRATAPDTAPVDEQTPLTTEKHDQPGEQAKPDTTKPVPPAQAPGNLPQEPPRTEPSPSTAEQTTTIVIEDTAYKPSLITVQRGTRVTWVNHDSVGHTVTADNGEGLNSGLLSAGESYSYEFTAVGTYNYHCVKHPRMQGTVKVVE